MVHRLSGVGLAKLFLEKNSHEIEDFKYIKCLNEIIVTKHVVYIKHMFTEIILHLSFHQITDDMMANDVNAK